MRSKHRLSTVHSMFASFGWSEFIMKNASRCPWIIAPVMWRVGLHSFSKSALLDKFLGHLNFAWSMPSKSTLTTWLNPSTVGCLAACSASLPERTMMSQSCLTSLTWVSFAICASCLSSAVVAVDLHSSNSAQILHRLSCPPSLNARYFSNDRTSNVAV